MLVARYWLAIPILAMAGSLARKKKVPAGSGTLPTHTPLFVGLADCHRDHCRGRSAFIPRSGFGADCGTFVDEPGRNILNDQTLQVFAKRTCKV